ncbi:MAG TPA: aminoglycoside adenylyltransferase domain-containing protein [Thermomicrobiales bacterium]|jgi:hypothetical protein|nr:aminoglycoside adenylyltransferase domain-containing protein [Thermomicrobiales bacterium]
MTAAVPPDVAALLDDLATGLGGLPMEPVGAYVFGSLVLLDGFDPPTSDIDVVVALPTAPDAAQVNAIRDLHKGLARRHQLARRLDVGYVTLRALRGDGDEAIPRPTFRDALYRPDGGADLNAVTRWVVRERGIRLLGPPPAALGLPVTWDDVLGAMRYNLADYWAPWQSVLALPRLLRQEELVWTVATLCRILVTVRDGEIVTKRAAVDRLRTNAPDQWHPLLESVAAIQRGHTEPLGPLARLGRARTARRFVRWSRQTGLTALDAPR